MDVEVVALSRIGGLQPPLIELVGFSVLVLEPERMTQLQDEPRSALMENPVDPLENGQEVLSQAFSLGIIFLLLLAPHIHQGGKAAYAYWVIEVFLQNRQCKHVERSVHVPPCDPMASQCQLQ